MVRFARAIGSKSSNKRVPEDATPWTQLSNSSAPKASPRKIVWKQQESSVDADDPLPVEEPPKVKSKKEHKRRKPLTDIPPIVKDGQEIGIVRFEGFPVRKHDADRLKELRKQLLKSNIPRAEVKKTLKLERRRAEKALARGKKKLCFHCRNSGHVLSECPELDKNDEQLPESGICFKCGSTEHQHTQCKAVRGDSYKYATCFICKEAGHISKQCPDNPRGLYPDGGGCRTCGDVTHLKKDCPRHQKRKKEEFEVTASLMNNEALDALDEELGPKEEILPPPRKKKKVIRM